MTYLWHMTLDTGHGHKSPRADVSDVVIKHLRPHLERAIANKTDPVPIDGGYALYATADGAWLLATVLDRDMAPIVTFGVAPRSRGAGRLWQMLHDGRPDLTTEPAQPPAAPWCAVRIEDQARLLPAVEWIADYERCIAWAWIEMRGDANG